MADRTARTQQEIHAESLQLAQDLDTHIIPFMEDEVHTFEAEVARFRAGEIDDTAFIPFRLRFGVYGQRQPDRQMMRVKIPGGILTPDALEGFGVLAKDYSPRKKGHLTTRENMQFHDVPLARTAEAMRLIGSIGLSGREACGNTVRNVVGSPFLGVHPEEIFDPTPYMAAFIRFAVRHPLTQTFPRKFKAAFTGTPHDDSITARIQDLTYIAQIREENGVQKKGFKIYVGGGTSIMPRLAYVLFELHLDGR